VSAWGRTVAELVYLSWAYLQQVTKKSAYSGYRLVTPESASVHLPELAPTLDKLSWRNSASSGHRLAGFAGREVSQRPGA